jgi:hypothetical protein
MSECSNTLDKIDRLERENRELLQANLEYKKLADEYFMQERAAEKQALIRENRELREAILDALTKMDYKRNYPAVMILSSAAAKQTLNKEPKT